MSEQPIMNERDEMEALLPFYLNGTLSDSDLDRVEKWLVSDPGALAALAEAEMEFSATLSVNEAILPPANSLSRFEASLDAIAGQKREAPIRAPGGLSKLVMALVSVPKSVAWATAAVALTLMVLQSGLDWPSTTQDYGVASTEPETAETYFLVSFTPDARISAITDLLEANGAVVSDGPMPNRMYRVIVLIQTDQEFDRIAKALAADPLVSQVIPGKRPTEQ